MLATLPAHVLAISASLLVPQEAAATLSNAGATLTVDGDSITVTKGDQPILVLEAIQLNYFEASGWTILEATDSAIAVRLTFPPEVDHGLSAYDDAPRETVLRISTVQGGFRLHAAPQWGRQTTLRTRHLGDHFFGLSAPLQPDNDRSPDLTGAVIDVEVDSRNATFYENYASAYSAFYMSSLGYGAFFDTFASGRYDFAINGYNRVHHETGTLDWYLFVGSDGAAIHRGYYALIGAPKPVPAWALGPVGWRDQNDGGSAEILADIRRMSELQIPFTAWWVDRPYSDGENEWSRMNFAADFPDPAEFIGTIREDYGLEFMTWASPATWGDVRFDRHLMGEYTYLDLSHPPTVAAYQDVLRAQQYAYGVKGHKIDRADQQFPVYEDWYDRSVEPDERYNRYVYLLARVHDEALREVWGDDQLTFARAAIHRVQPWLSAIWGGDPRSTWAGMRGNFANAARSAFMGFPVWGGDAGGYLGPGRIPEDLYIRWLQAGSMAGLFEIKLDGSGGSGEDRMPWRYGPTLQRAFRSIAEDRMRFVPYLYSLARTSATTGTLMQPLAYRHLDDPATYDVWDQFYLGPAILVAPVFGPGTERPLYLPEGAWRALDEPSERYEGGRTLTVDAPLTRLPRFVRDNSIYVTGTVIDGNTFRWRDEPHHLTVHAAPGRAVSSSRFIYVDRLDGDAEKTVELATDARGLTLAVPALTVAATAEIILDAPPSAVTVNGAAADASFDPDRSVLTVTLPMGEAAEISTRF